MANKASQNKPKKVHGDTPKLTRMSCYGDKTKHTHTYASKHEVDKARRSAYFVEMEEIDRAQVNTSINHLISEQVFW